MKYITSRRRSFRLLLIVALWSAGKGVLAVSTGLNCAYELRETRNYVFLRIRASIYTILFIAAIVMALVLSVFGNNISIFIYHKIPFLAETTDMIMRLRTVISFVVMTGISLLVYHFFAEPGSFRSGIWFWDLFSVLWDGWWSRLFFQCIWQSSKGFPVCTEVWRRSFLWCCGCISVCMWCCWEGLLTVSG